MGRILIFFLARPCPFLLKFFCSFLLLADGGCGGGGLQANFLVDTFQPMNDHSITLQSDEEANRPHSFCSWKKNGEKNKAKKKTRGSE